MPADLIRYGAIDDLVARGFAVAVHAIAGAVPAEPTRTGLYEDRSAVTGGAR